MQLLYVTDTAAISVCREGAAGKVWLDRLSSQLQSIKESHFLFDSFWTQVSQKLPSVLFFFLPHCNQVSHRHWRKPVLHFLTSLMNPALVLKWEVQKETDFLQNPWFEITVVLYEFKTCFSDVLREGERTRTNKRVQALITLDFLSKDGRRFWMRICRQSIRLVQTSAKDPQS